MDSLQPVDSVEAVAVVMSVRRQRGNVALAAGLGIAAAAFASLAGASWLVAAIVACVVFPVAARLSRALQATLLRRRFARDPAEAQRQAQAAWAAASPGQRAALEMLVKKSR